LSENSLNKLLIRQLLEFIERDFMEEEVRVEVIGEAPTIFTTEGVIELTRGAEYMIPRRIAYDLASKGIVRIKNDALELEDLSKLVYLEEATSAKPKLAKAKPFMYNLVLHRLHTLEDELRKKASIELFDEYRKMTDLYSNLLRIRVRKIISLLNMREVPQDLVDTMSMEEKVLFGALWSSLKEWKNSLGVEKTS
jgi:DNA replication factor GINS